MVLERNILRDRFENDDVAIGAACHLFSHTVIEIFGELGLDYVFMDYEHNGTSVWDSLEFEQITRTAQLADIEPIVRIPSGTEHTHPGLVRKVLDTGIRNILVPRIETATEVRSAVEAARFTYEGSIGDRGAGSARGSGWGNARGPEWVADEDELTLIGVMIENRTAVENIDEIVSVPDLGFVIIGSSDLSISLGCPFDRSASEFKSALTSVRTACRDAGVPFGQMGVGADEAAQTVDAGGRILNVGSDIGAIRAAIGQTLDNLEY